MSLISRLLGSRAAAVPPGRAAAASPPGSPAPAGRPAASTDVGLVAFFTADHRDIDAVWAEVESAPDLAGAVDAARRFDAALRRHLDWEEQVLFPAFEDATGHHGFGPTEVMRGEHAHMRAILDEMARCAAEEERTALEEQGDTLMMLIQQHNAKEEGMLYPMANQVLGDPGWQAMAARFR
ncbi:MAG: hemerythrin domain-containing protein [Pseudomonadota bacterium]|nr:hemerythrin domain-containing protein [Pseudomonadota bacterium]